MFDDKKEEPGFFSGLTIKDVFKAGVALETAKVNARMNATAPSQQAGFNNPGRPQNPQAKTGQGVTLPGGITFKQAGLGLLLAGLKVAKVF